MFLEQYSILKNSMNSIIELLGTYRDIIHYGLHFVFPVFLAYIIFKKIWKRAYIIMLCTMIVDLDHLLADPIFDPNRCSIGFHPLHSYPAILFYLILIVHPRSRIIGIGLIFHMVTDWIDCILM